MERKIASFHSVMGLRMALISAALAILALINSVLTIFIILAAFFALGIAFLLIGWMRGKRLAHLQASGAAYDADSIDYAPVYLLRVWGYITFRAYFTYTDDKGAEHTTKTRWYCLCLGHSDVNFTPLDEFHLSAKIYVNPDDMRDYAVDMHAEK
ncbi:MAG: hypothetical protein FWC76_00670 [Defluviitaleaceae bacterium]|nr:hypothetical protein [Defluviitaleaceae bacterium]